MSARSRPLAVWALIALALIWGYTWVIIKKVMGYSGPFDFAALRTVLGSLALFAALALLRRPLVPPAKFQGVALLGLLQTAGFTGLSQWALVAGAAGKTAVLTYTMPFWVLILAWLLLGERLHGWQWLAVVLALAGLILILEPWRLAGNLASGLLAILAGVAWAASAIVVKKLRRSPGFDLLSLTAWQMLVGAVILAGVAVVVPSRSIEWSGYFIGAVIYTTFASTALAWLLWVYVLNHLPAGTASLGLLATPAVGVLAAWIELGERPGNFEIAGMILIAAALVVLSALTMVRKR